MRFREWRTGNFKVETVQPPNVHGAIETNRLMKNNNECFSPFFKGIANGERNGRNVYISFVSKIPGNRGILLTLYQLPNQWSKNNEKSRKMYFSDFRCLERDIV